MNNILWYQPEKLSDGDVVLFNGTPLSNGVERDNAFNQLKVVSDKATGKKRPWQGYVDNYYFVKGSLDRLDERGRPLSFIFISDSNNGKKELYNSLKKIGIDVSADTSNFLRKNVSRRNRSKILLSIVLLLCILLLIYFLNNKYGK